MPSASEWRRRGPSRSRPIRGRVMDCSAFLQYFSATVLRLVTSLYMIIDIQAGKTEFKFL